MGGSVYAFAGGKGGVGKTTSTANVAIALSEKGYDVAAIDTDVGMTNLGEFLGVSCKGDGIHEVLSGKASVKDVVVRGPADIGVVPGCDRLDANADVDPSKLREAVDPLREIVDVVLLDTGAGISHLNLVAYGLSDAIALVTTADNIAVGDADKTADLADHVDCPVVGTVVTRVGADTDLRPLARRLDGDVLAAIPEYTPIDAPEPRVHQAPDSPAAAEYRRLATTMAVCHQTGDLDRAASEASDEVTLPGHTGTDAGGPTETTDDGSDGGASTGGVIQSVLSRLPIGG